MRVLQVNKFFYYKGGSEFVFFDMIRLLKKRGHRVSYFAMSQPENLSTEYQKYFVSNIDFGNKGLIKKCLASLRILYSLEAKRKIAELIKEEKPDIVHLNNIYHQISPSILHVLKKARIPVVMTLHDYKLVCASYSMLNKHKACQDCKGGRYYNCLKNSCFKGARSKSLISTLEMYLHHKVLRIYRLVDSFISPSLFLQSKIRDMGFEAKITHLPNFVEAANYRPYYGWRENSVVYFGRLSEEKGLFTLIEAAKRLPHIEFKIIGAGQINRDLAVKARKEKTGNVRFLGRLSGEALKEEISRSMFTLLPSECYENNPRSVIESFALGKPVVASRIGGIPELVKDDFTGLLFEPKDPVGLSQRIESLVSQPEKVFRMGQNARRLVEEEFNAEKYYQGLYQIYEAAINNSRKT